MSLTKVFAPFFQSTIRSRGRQYFQSGRVQLETPRQGEWLRASVRGSETYTVALRGEGSDTQASCTCAYFAGGAYCKHLWAAILYAQQHGLTPQSGGATGAQGVEFSPRAPKARRRAAQKGAAQREEARWVGQLALLRPHAEHGSAAPLLTLEQLLYAVDVEASIQAGGTVVRLYTRHPVAEGWSKPRRMRLGALKPRALPDPADREITALLVGAAPVDSYSPEDPEVFDVYHLTRGAGRFLLRRMIVTGRAFVLDPNATGEAAMLPLRWDDHAEAWSPWLTGTLTDVDLRLTLELRRGTERLTINEPLLLVGGGDGVLLRRHGEGEASVACFEDGGAFRWVTQFRDAEDSQAQPQGIVVPTEDIARFLDRLYLLPNLPEMELPAGVGKPLRHLTPEPTLELATPGGGVWDASGARKQVTARFAVKYGSVRVAVGSGGRFLSMPDGSGQDTILRRDTAKEDEFLGQLLGVGFRPEPAPPQVAFPAANPLTDVTLGTIPVRSVPAVVESLLAAGWRVTANQRVLRGGARAFWSVSTGVDWFELRGGLRFATETGSVSVDIAALLAAAKSGRNFVELGDGSTALLPEHWLQQHGLLTALGKIEGDHLRFRTSQAAILDALLDRQTLQADERFEHARRQLAGFDRIHDRTEPPTFTGSLRPYQRQGLGWLDFLRAFGMGGVLADDMGLGKTVQVLAFLDAIYGRDQTNERAKDDDKLHAETPASPTVARSDGPPLPTLIVVPRSVVFNWIDEARRFAPQLRVQAYTGADRQSLRQAFRDHDVIVTSYGLMRRDILELKEHAFRYVVLDEAQAIKNPASQSAKAARLLRAEHRLALTGTPVENHLGDLWSIFEFLNPGMLGSGARFTQLLKGGSRDASSVEAAKQAGKVLRPFILRRTKKQVLDDLPEKTEQTILCTMEDAQRKFYDDLLRHYRSSLLKPTGNGHDRVAGGAVAPFMVLEALLRLRQAACHPGLIDAGLASGGSAKLDTLIVRISDLIEENHKALVFSQFTSLLALVRKELDQRGIVYEYLDGQTRDRQACVRRFQSDEACPLFLVSLKAGGLGLNLTAADYVFILDPWWNPAVEAQAIDRAHRIGQTQHVFAYRLICENTVEQRIAQLQEKKKALADAIVEGQESLLASLTREDLEMLLS